MRHVETETIIAQFHDAAEARAVVARLRDAGAPEGAIRFIVGSARDQGTAAECAERDSDRVGERLCALAVEVTRAAVGMAPVLGRPAVNNRLMRAAAQAVDSTGVALDRLAGAASGRTQSEAPACSPPIKATITVIAVPEEGNAMEAILRAAGAASVIREPVRL